MSKSLSDMWYGMEDAREAADLRLEGIREGNQAARYAHGLVASRGVLHAWLHRVCRRLVHGWATHARQAREGAREEGAREREGELAAGYAGQLAAAVLLHQVGEDSRVGEVRQRASRFFRHRAWSHLTTRAAAAAVQWRHRCMCDKEAIAQSKRRQGAMVGFGRWLELGRSQSCHRTLVHWLRNIRRAQRREWIELDRSSEAEVVKLLSIITIYGHYS
jgi:hypothetical protein